MAGFKVKGLDAIVRKLESLPDAVARKIIKEGLQPSAELLKKAVEAEAPRGETGNLAASVNVVPAKTKKGYVALDVRIGAGDFLGKQYYAAMIEFGTSKMSPQPFMRKAFESTAAEARDLAIENILKLVEKETSK